MNGIISVRQSRGRRGFTLIEVLATLMLMAIVLPAIMNGITLATGAATSSRRRSEASGLAASKLQEIVAGQQWQNGSLSGDFSPDWPDYRWQATVTNWPQDNTNVGLEQIDIQVMWTARNRPDSLTLSTLAYQRSQQQ